MSWILHEDAVVVGQKWKSIERRIKVLLILLINKEEHRPMLLINYLLVVGNVYFVFSIFAKINLNLTFTSSTLLVFSLPPYPPFSPHLSFLLYLSTLPLLKATFVCKAGKSDNELWWKVLKQVHGWSFWVWQVKSKCLKPAFFLKFEKMTVLLTAFMTSVNSYLKRCPIQRDFVNHGTFRDKQSIKQGGCFAWLLFESRVAITACPQVHGQIQSA